MMVMVKTTKPVSLRVLYVVEHCANTSWYYVSYILPNNPIKERPSLSVLL